MFYLHQITLSISGILVGVHGTRLVYGVPNHNMVLTALVVCLAWHVVLLIVGPNRN